MLSWLLLIHRGRTLVMSTRYRQLLMTADGNRDVEGRDSGTGRDSGAKRPGRQSMERVTMFGFAASGGSLFQAFRYFSPCCAGAGSAGVGACIEVWLHSAEAAAAAQGTAEMERREAQAAGGKKVRNTEHPGPWNWNWTKRSRANPTPSPPLTMSQRPPPYLSMLAPGSALI